MSSLRSLLFSSLFVTVSIVGAAAAFAAEDEMQVLQMYYDEADLVVSVTRNTRPLSAVAETITVISSREIAAMNAHTADEVLEKVTGVHRELRGGPANANFVTIRGSDFNQVRVLLDGVTLNSVSSNYSDLSILPVAMIERIEVLKGPASSVWGSALGGVINIVTRQPAAQTSGSGYLSGGEYGFRDLHGDLSGTKGSLGYYLYAGNLSFDGLRPNAASDVSSFFTKGVWQPAKTTSVESFLLFSDGSRKIGEEGLRDDNDPRRLYAGITARHSLRDNLLVEAALRLNRTDDDFVRAGGVTASASDMAVGGSVVLKWNVERHAAAVGFDYDRGGMDFAAFAGRARVMALGDDVDKWGVFVTDTFALEDLTITPGLRYDRTGGIGSGFTPSLGATYRLSEGTMLRAMAARGFSLPQITGSGRDKLNRIWTLQGGGESTAVPFLWLRASLFHSLVSNIQTFDEGLSRRHQTGVEAELKTTPLWNTTLSAGFTYLKTEEGKSGGEVKGIPTHSWNIGVNYDDLKSLQAALHGRYVWWNGPSFARGRYSDFIWDLNLSRKFSLGRSVAPELFFSLHNVFDGKQYLYTFFKNAGRWAEGGIRFSF